MSKTRWGDTAPFLKIAQHFGVDYSVTLALGDHFLRGQPLPNAVIPPLSGPSPELDHWHDLCDECAMQANRFMELRAGAPL